MRAPLIAACALVLPLASCESTGTPRDQNLLITYSRIVADLYEVDGDLNAANGFVTDKEPDVDGWNVQLDIDTGMSLPLGVLVGYSEREFGFDAESTEYSAGVKYWAGGENSYLTGLVRYADEMEFEALGAAPSDEYWGYGVGLGVTSQATDNIYLDLRVLYEGLFDDISSGPDNLDLSGIVLTLGVGLLF